MPIRAVFDTNVWISGLMWRGAPYRCLLLARTGLVQLRYCPSMSAELAEKLRHKFRYSEHEIRAVLYEFHRIATRVEIPGQLKVVAADPDDDKFIECALMAGVEIIVSEDRHLLSLVQYKTTRILTSAAFLLEVDNSTP
jgi:putative PIN family toxin of toxin-antitoxin system